MRAATFSSQFGDEQPLRLSAADSYELSYATIAACSPVASGPSDGAPPRVRTG